LVLFSNEQIILDKRRNFFVHPVVIPILLTDNERVSNLYHENYKEIAPGHWNTDLEVGLVGKCPSLANELESLSNLLTLNLTPS